MPLRYNLHRKQTGGGLAHVHDPDSVLKSEGWVRAPSLSSCFRVILITHLWWVLSAVDEADGSFDMSLCPMISIWLRLSIVSLSDPITYSMSSKEMSKWCQSWGSFWRDFMKPVASKSLLWLPTRPHHYHSYSVSRSQFHFCFKSTYLLILKSIHIQCWIHAQKKINVPWNSPIKKCPVVSNSAYPLILSNTCAYLHMYTTV